MMNLVMIWLSVGIHNEDSPAKVFYWICTQLCRAKQQYVIMLARAAS